MVYCNISHYLRQVSYNQPTIPYCTTVDPISTQHAVGLYWFAGHAAVGENEIAAELAKESSVQKFVGPEPSLEVSRHSIRKIRSWLDNQQWARWRGLGSTHRQARELISGPSPSAKTRILSFNRTKSRVMSGLLTGHNTLKRHLHLLGLTN